MPITIKNWLDNASKQLKEVGITSSRLDSEIILCNTLKKNRTWIHAHTDEMLDMRRRDIADARLSLRADRVPLAYIIGYKEFYGKEFYVSPATLIPRPESEAGISIIDEWIKDSNHLHKPLSCIDVGSGSGCIGISLKLLHPNLNVSLIDISKKALAVAQKNAQRHDVEVNYYTGSLLSEYPYSPDIIIANLPYVDKKWETSPETNYEPADALYAPQDGLKLILALLDTASSRLSSNGIIALESDTRQHSDIIAYAVKNGYTHVKTEALWTVFCLSNNKERLS